MEFDFILSSSNFLLHIFQSEIFSFCFCFQDIAVTNTTVEDITETNEVQGFLFGKLK